MGAFFAGENGNSTTGDAIYMRGADTSNSIYIDGIRDIGSVSRDTFNTEQVEVIKRAFRHRLRAQRADGLDQYDQQAAAQ